ncbi:uncharacterized protein [Rutidosis leptorrhynchoides]|uniref:uncharacterized protein n=1 Tax=Rutidosis leptorrhynchoides TaxID=125765 RepID=UPI003A98FA73
MPMEWRVSEIIPIYKNKGDAQTCTNYRGIKLLSHTMKLWERVIDSRLRRVTNVSENKFGFMPGRSSIEAIHIIRNLREKYREKQKNLEMVFIDLEKAYDCVPRNLIWKTLRDRSILSRYISAIKDMYEGAKSCVRTPVGNIEVFPIEVGLHQDDIVLVSESKEELNRRLEQWRMALEGNGLQISRQKTEYLRCDFDRNNDEQDDGVNICIGEQVLHPKTFFRYLGSMLHKSGRIDEDVSHRIKVGWMKWRAIYTDLGYGGENRDKKLTSEYFALIGGNLVTWRSKKQKVVALSSAEAEFRGIAKGVTEAIWIKKLLTEIEFPPIDAIKIMCNNEAAIAISKNPIQHDRTKHVFEDEGNEESDKGIGIIPKMPSHVWHVTDI